MPPQKTPMTSNPAGEQETTRKWTNNDFLSDCSYKVTESQMSFIHPFVLDQIHCMKNP